MRLLFGILFALSVMPLFAKSDVVYLEKVGNGGTRVFSVVVPVMDKEPETIDLAKRTLINALLFEGVENYNGGFPLVSNPEHIYAKEMVDPNRGQYRIYSKEIYYENRDSRSLAYFTIVLNHFNLLRVLNMRKAMDTPFAE